MAHTTMAVFDKDPFQPVEFIHSVETVNYVPMGLDTIVGFEPIAAFTNTVAIKKEGRTARLIRTTELGAPIEMAEPDEMNVRDLRCRRLAKGAKLFASELKDFIPDLSVGETSVDLVMERIVQMQRDLIRDVEFTEEHMRYGALKGIVLDANGATLYNYWNEFGVTQPADIDLALDASNPVEGALAKDIASRIAIPIAKAKRDGMMMKPQLRAICSDSFYLTLAAHKDVQRTYTNQIEAGQRRGENDLFESFDFGGVKWYHYTGTEDGTTLAIPDGKAFIFPYGVKGMFQHVMCPGGEFFDLIGSRGRRYIPFLIRDNSGRNQWVQPEIYAYPLFVNARPDLVLTATI